jgi:hypothetical protein
MTLESIPTSGWIFAVNNNCEWHIYGPYPSENVARVDAERLKDIWSDESWNIDQLRFQKIEWFSPEIKNDLDHYLPEVPAKGLGG